MNQTTTPTQQDKGEVWVITHFADSSWRCLFALIVEGERPSIIETIEVQGDEALTKLLQERSPSNIISILPGSVTVCRTTILPDVDNDQVLEVLRLQAEAKLLGGTPPHRRAMAPLDASIGETNRVGLIVSWPENSTYTVPSCLMEANFIPDACSIASLLNGHRPIEPIIIADASDGTVTLALTHANGSAIRATREDYSTQTSFIDSIIRTTKETASIHNHTTSFTEALISKLHTTLSEISSESPLVVLPDEIIEATSKQIDGTPSNNKPWWRKWGIAVGGLIATEGSLQGLTTMRFNAPETNPSAIDRWVLRLSERSFATRLAIAAVLLLALGPAIVSGVKLGLLRTLHPNIESQYSQAVEEKKQQLVYKELGKIAWPMTKIIADITNNIPVGIDVESIRIDVGDPVSIRGSAREEDGKTAAELIASMQENLQSTGMFDEIQFSYETAGTYGNRDFDLWATVINPLKRPRYSTEEDFGIWTLAMRADGTPPGELVEEETINSNIIDEGVLPLSNVNSDSNSENTDTPAYIGNHEERERPSRPRPSGGSSGAQSHSDVRVSGGASSRIPEPLSEAQIAVMTASEARIALAAVSEALNHLSGDDEAKARLRKEMHLLFARMKELQ